MRSTALLNCGQAQICFCVYYRQISPSGKFGSSRLLKDQYQCLLRGAWGKARKHGRLVPGTTKEELKKWAIARVIGPLTASCNSCDCELCPAVMRNAKELDFRVTLVSHAWSHYSPRALSILGRQHSAYSIAYTCTAWMEDAIHGQYTDRPRHGPRPRPDTGHHARGHTCYSFGSKRAPTMAPTRYGKAAA